MPFNHTMRYINKENRDELTSWGRNDYQTPEVYPYPPISHSLICHTVYNYTGQGLVHT